MELLSCILLALFIDESSAGKNLVGDDGKSIGAFQIQTIAVEDVNQHYGTDYTPDDRWNQAKSWEIAELYLRLIAYRLEWQGIKPTPNILIARYKAGDNWKSPEAQRYTKRTIKIMMAIIKGEKRRLRDNTP
jgi:hypothetical protein